MCVIRVCMLRVINPGHDKGYPFRLYIELHYVLCDDGFRCEVYVTNKDNKDAPFACGWHPYFKLSPPSSSSVVESKHTVHGYKLRIPAQVQFVVDKQMIPVKKVKYQFPHTNVTIAPTTQLDTGFVADFQTAPIVHISRPWSAHSKAVEPRRCETVLSNPAMNVSLSLWQQDSMPYIQVYIPPSRDCVAIEPSN